MPTACAARRGGVALLAINNDRAAPRMLTVPVPGERYTLSSDDLQGKTVRLNGVELELGADDALPDLTAAPMRPGDIRWIRPRSRSSPCPEPETRRVCSARDGITIGCAARQIVI